jgi:hypothetical protein
MGTEQFAVVAIDPDRCGGKVQIPHLALGPAVHPGGRLATAMANGLKALVGLYLNPSFGRIFRNLLADNFDSTKRKIGCYSGFGHRRPPLDMFFLGRKNQYPLEVPDVHSVLIDDSLFYLF